MKRQGILSNSIFQFLYQGLILIIPLIISPFLTRVLGIENIGIYTYVNSIASWFVVFSMLGVVKYGQRAIAQNDDDGVNLRTTFWSLFCLHVIVAVVFTVLYVIFVAVCVQEYASIYYLQVIYVLSALFDVTWLFYGLQNFKSVVVKNAIVKLLECCMIFMFVRDENDLHIYTIIAGGAVFFGQFLMIPTAIKNVKPIKCSLGQIFSHFKPMAILSISAIAVSLYTIFGKTLLGLLANTNDVAIYEYSNKIINVPKTIITVFGTVMFPKACQMVASGNTNSQKKYLRYTFFACGFIGIGAIFGLLAIADPLAVLYFGEEFASCGLVIKCLSPLIFIIGVGDVIRTQYMIPNHMDKRFTVCILISAALSLAISFVLIPPLGVYGAVIAALVAESFGLIYQIIVCRKHIKVTDIISNTAPFIAIGVIMLIIIKLCWNVMNYNVLSLIICGVIGLAAYALLAVVYVLVFRRSEFKFILKK